MLKCWPLPGSSWSCPWVLRCLTPPNFILLANQGKRLSDWIDNEAIIKNKITFLKWTLNFFCKQNMLSFTLYEKTFSWVIYRPIGFKFSGNVILNMLLCITVRFSGIQTVLLLIMWWKVEFSAIYNIYTYNLIRAICHKI